MPSRPSLPAALRIWAALLLAVIGLQATAPVTTTLHQTHGSAFSATTYETAVHRQVRDDEPVRMAVTEPPAPEPFLRTPAPPRTLTGQFTPRGDSTGPPLPGIRATPSAPRAPPQA